jgi:predicted TIM-barrel fold metal-dependent hydrolase
VIVDCHTHVFPPAVDAHREDYIAADGTFAEMYGNPDAKLASADALLRSMDAAGVDASVALGFAWTDHETCRQHNDYLIEAQSAHPGRVIAFPTLPLAAGTDAIEREARRCVAAGARGFGELRPDNLDFDLEGAPGDCLARLATDLNSVLLFHVTEPAGHSYPGKQGLALERFYRFVKAHPDVRVIAAHWGGGLPFYASMPEVSELPNVSYDTAASSLLYDEHVYERVAGLIGPERILFGSDYPLLSQARSKRRIEAAGLGPEAQRMVLGENAAALLGLS